MISYHRKRKIDHKLKYYAKKTLKECRAETVDFLVRNFRMFSEVVKWVVLVFLYMFFRNIGAETIHAAIVFALVILFFVFLDKLYINVKSETKEGIPIPKKRITMIDERGYINISDIDEAAGYLCDVEDYLQRKGLLKDDESMQRVSE